MIVGVLFCVVAAVAFAAAGVRWAGWPRPRTPAQRAMLATLLLLGVMCLCQAGQNVGDLVAPSARLVANLTMVVAAVSTLAMIDHLVAEPAGAAVRARRRRVVTAIGCVVLVVTYVGAGRLELGATRFGGGYLQSDLLTVYTATFLLYFVVALVRTLDLGIRHALRRPITSGLGLGLWMVALAAVCGLLHGLSKAAAAVSEVVFGVVSEKTGLCSSPLDSVDCFASVGLPLLYVTLLALGMTATLWLGWLGEPLAELANRRVMRELRPLWQDLTSPSMVPEVTLLGPNSVTAEATEVRSEVALYRMVIEIDDALLVLTQEERQPVAPDGEPGPRTASAADEAALVARVVARGRTPGGPAPTPSDAPEPPLRSEEDFTQETQRVRRLAAEYAKLRR